MHPTPEIATAKVAANRDEYGPHYDELRFVTTREAEVATARREALLDSIRGRAAVVCKGSKVHGGELSPGCRSCVAGTWSCLFVTGRCNCRCSFCPTPQDEEGVPGTNTIDFPRARDYAEYTERFGFDGVSFSGGEPLLSPDRTFDYLRAVRARRGDEVWTWLYTNGSLLHRPLLERLRDAGLNELRVDVAAVGYDLAGVALAVGVIPTVTVEIPALPEDAGRLRELLPALADLGVDHLNLHQLRLTPHNRSRLAHRGYTFLHGDRVTVLESELLALELVADALDRGIDLPVNYCSYVYKSRFQGVAARRRAARVVGRPWEEITENGYLRALSLAGPVERLRREVEHLGSVGAAPELHRLESEGKLLTVAPSLWPWIDARDLELHVRYAEARLRSRLSYQLPFVEVELESGASFYAERLPSAVELHLAGGEATGFVAGGSGRGAALELESIRSGLQEYY